MMLKLKIFSVLLVLISPIATTHATEYLVIEDGLKLAVEISGNKNAQKSVLLLHQYNRDQRMWIPLVKQLEEQGINAMAVDFRGFGRSKSLKFNSDISHKEYDKATAYIQNDIHAIYTYWLSKTINSTRRAIVGASCGGGAASILAGIHPEINALVLLSPSLRPYWYATDNWPLLMKRVDLPVLGITSIKDKNAVLAVEKIVNNSKASYTQQIRYHANYHGEPLFKHDVNLSQKITSWIITSLE